MPQERRIGRYTLVRVLGSGATGQVWEATDETGRPCAVKLLRSELADDQAVVHRFIAERNALLEVDDPHVVSMHDLVAEQGQLGIVMDLVQGGSLRDALSRFGTLAPGEVARIGAGIAHGLQALHAAGVVHRDIKPENVLMDATVQPAAPRLTDFGIAKVLETSGASARSTALVGTPAYLAPELGDGEPPSPASDLYALGITLYECVCGVTPFKSASPLAMLRQHADRIPGRPDGVPDPLWDLIAHLLVKSPAGRPQSAGWVASVLGQMQPRLVHVPALSALREPPVSTSVAAGSDTVQAPWARDANRDGAGEHTQPGTAGARPKKRHGKAILAGVAAVVVLVAGGTAYALSRGGDGSSEAATTSKGTVTAPTGESTTTSGTTSDSTTPHSTSPSSSPSSTSTTTSPPTTMPKVVGMALGDAEYALPGISVQTKDTVSEKKTDGTVLRQSPKAGAALGDSVTLTVARQPVTQYLDDFDTTSGDEFESGAVTSDKVTYPHALSDEYFCGEYSGASQNAEQWNLGGHYQKLRATIGQDDNSPSATSTGLVQVFGDGRQLFSKTVKFGTAVPLDVDVTDVLRLKIEIDGSRCEGDATMVLGNIRLLGLHGEVPLATDTGQ